MFRLFILFLLMSQYIYSQSEIATPFYTVKIPEGSVATIFKSSSEENAVIDIYRIDGVGKPPYLLYLMSNRLLTQEPDVNVDNFTDYLSDLGNLKILQVDFERAQPLITFQSNISEKTYYKMSPTIINDILCRFLFLIPKSSTFDYNSEINFILQNITYNKKSW